MSEAKTDGRKKNGGHATNGGRKKELIDPVYITIAVHGYQAEKLRAMGDKKSYSKYIRELLDKDQSEQAELTQTFDDLAFVADASIS